jgi:glycoside/pentoside/hexuronide:cation symporter, GPH family
MSSTGPRSAPPPVPAPAPAAALSPSLRRGYALGGVASGFYGTVPGVLLLPYLTDTVGIGAVAAGVVVFAPKAWDFFLNPVAGRISDRSTHPAGRRRPFMLWAGLVMAATFVLIFSGPVEPAWLATAWVLTAYVLCASAYAFFQVPYLAMSAEITDDYAERTRLMTWRVVVVTLSIMLAGATAPLAVELFGGAGSAAGHRGMSAYIGLVIAAGALGVWWATRHAPTVRLEPTASLSLREQLRVATGDPHARVLITSFVLQAVAMSMVLGGVAYAARVLLGDPVWATYVFVAFVAPAIAFAPLWARIGVRQGKKHGFMLASGVLLVGLVALALVATGSPAATLVCSGIVGAGYAGCQLFPLAMLPDVAARDASLSGENRIGMLTGLWAGFELLGFAIGPACFAFVLALGGYVSAAGGDVVQPASAELAIMLGVSLIPAALVALSLVVVRGYRLDDLVRA